MQVLRTPFAFIMMVDLSIVGSPHFHRRTLVLELADLKLDILELVGYDLIISVIRASC